MPNLGPVVGSTNATATAEAHEPRGGAVARNAQSFAAMLRQQIRNDQVALVLIDTPSIIAAAC
jgi:hypothetical protein